MDERTTEDLSAYLDDELGPAESARIAGLVASSAQARSELDRLAAARDLVRAAAARPTGTEVEAMDAAVLAPTRPAPLPVRAASPRKRGRPSWPYFVVAASIAVILSLGMVVLVQVIGRDTGSSTAAVSRPESQVESDAPSEVSGDATVRDPGTALPAPASLPPREPELYLSDLAVADSTGLAALAGRGPAPKWSRDEGIADLVELGAGAGLDRAELETCLAAAGPGVPVRVDVGSFAGAPAFLVVLADADTSNATVAAVARSSCTPIAAVATGS